MLIILLVVFIFLLLIGTPIAYSMGIAAMASLLSNPEIPGLVAVQRIFNTCDSFSLMAIPFFMLSGHLMTEAGITKLLVSFSHKLVGHIRGGLAQTTVLSGMLMAGVSGSANADASAIGSIMMPALKEDGYEEGWAVSLVASAAALGPIIPPSIIMIIYSGITSISIAELFMAGIVPGILSGVGFMVLSYIYARRHGFKPGARPKLKEIFKEFKQAFWALLMPLIIIVGIVSGVFTATEAGAITVFYGLAYGLISKKLDWEKIKRALTKAVLSTVVPMMIIAIAAVVGYILSRENFASYVAGSITSLTSSPIVTLLIIVFFLTILGMFIDATAVLTMTVPVLVPLAMIYQFNPIYFAMIIVIVVVSGGLTPPVGMLFYIVSSVGHVAIEKVVKPIIPFILVVLAVVLLIIFIPPLVTFIPSLFY